ncbi:hypothetical protein [Zobellia galactanivorans]|uniref:hypothetical protein n=1 Tax=Zobellia galactanivorans (strain DSM 12802 / CCUG 47099 / CIP 106680 / NCIMB 13871 / Dsij) TaxID=63186 RepID=UPI001C0729F5|nr:hypothetical protein [Zobellia galactanivorans]MBU3024083.1 hypothetical protein [Zobellia galactanivorans]
MKSRIYPIAVFLIGSLLFSCEKSDLEYENDFQNSRNAWLDFKESSNNSYKYVVLGGSVFTDYGWETTITVSNGTITQRHFRYISNTELPDTIPEEEAEWTENEAEINNREFTSAAQALTLDEIYNEAQQNWLLRRNNTKVYFEAGNNGLISSCIYIEDGCMDDCFNGIKIKSIQAL